MFVLFNTSQINKNIAFFFCVKENVSLFAQSIACRPRYDTRYWKTQKQIEPSIEHTQTKWALHWTPRWKGESWRLVITHGAWCMVHRQHTFLLFLPAHTLQNPPKKIWMKFKKKKKRRRSRNIWDSVCVMCVRMRVDHGGSKIAREQRTCRERKRCCYRREGMPKKKEKKYKKVGRERKTKQ